MPAPAPHPCSEPGCPALVTGRVRSCAQHAGGRDRWRGSAASRGYGAAWRKLRKRVLLEEPICRKCRKVAATEVDHLVPREAGGSDERENLQGLCKPCHSNKTATEDGGFGYARQCGVVFVCGPPGAGKSTLVRCKAEQEDLIVDLERLAAALSLAPTDGRTGVGSALLPFACEARDAVLARLARPHSMRRAWVVASAPRAEDRERIAQQFPRAEILVLEASTDECMRRLQRDPLRSGAAALLEPVIHGWWRAYRRRPAGERWIERGFVARRRDKNRANQVFFSGNPVEGPQGGHKRAPAKCRAPK